MLPQTLPLAPEAGAARVEPPERIRAFVESHCTSCHDAATRKQGLDLETLPFGLSDPALLETWAKVLDQVQSGQMPPAKKPRPVPEELRAFSSLLGESLHEASLRRQREVGRTMLRRLNATQWEATVRELLSIDLALKPMLPEDTPVHGFDTVAEGLRFSQLHMEGYLDAADAALDAAIRLGAAPPAVNQRFSYKDEKGIRKNLDTPEGTIEDPVAKSKHRVIFRELPDAVVFYSEGYSPTELKQFQAKAPGRYRVRVSGYAYNSGGRPVWALLYSHRHPQVRLAAHFDMPPGQPRVAEAIVTLERGETLRVAPFDTGYDAKGRDIWQQGAAAFEGAGLAVQWVEVQGPLDPAWPPASLRAALGDTPIKELPARNRPWRNNEPQAYAPAPSDSPAAVRAAVEDFARRAIRRPVSQEEIEPFVSLALAALGEGSDFIDAVRLGLRAVLTSPGFLIIEEAPGPLDGHALATRLSYFLWSLPPDEELRRLAASGELTRPDTLRAQTQRLLQDPRSASFVRHFTGQWLDLRRIDATSPDMRLYPEFDTLLQFAMVAESEAFFAHLLAQDLPVDRFIDSDFVMLNRRIAEHYGIPGVVGEHFRPVPVPVGSPRGGVLGQAAVLKVTANGTVTSPVLRGTWVLKRLLGQTPLAPPADVGAIEPDTRGATTVREQLAQHRKLESCNSCHRAIDPPGFALECFDVIGGYRERYRSQGKGDPVKDVLLRGRGIHQYRWGPAVDASGQTQRGEAFADFREFKKLLMNQREDVARALASKLLTYASGAPPQFADREVIDGVLAQTRAGGFGLRSLVHAVVQSRSFRNK